MQISNIEDTLPEPPQQKTVLQIYVYIYDIYIYTEWFAKMLRACFFRTGVETFFVRFPSWKRTNKRSGKRSFSASFWASFYFRVRYQFSNVLVTTQRTFYFRFRYRFRYRFPERVFHNQIEENKQNKNRKRNMPQYKTKTLLTFSRTTKFI